MRTLWVVCAVLAVAAPLAAAPRQRVEPLYAPGGRILAPEPFPDVPRSHWAYEAVEYLRQLGLVEGYPAVKNHQPTRTFNAPEPPARPVRPPSARRSPAGPRNGTP